VIFFVVFLRDVAFFHHWTPNLDCRVLIRGAESCGLSSAKYLAVVHSRLNELLSLVRLRSAHETTLCGQSQRTKQHDGMDADDGNYIASKAQQQAIATERHLTINTLVVVVLVCPCALTISSPITYAAGLAALPHCGIFVKGGKFFRIIGPHQACDL
jgi:hypothetical protein